MINLQTNKRRAAIARFRRALMMMDSLEPRRLFSAAHTATPDFMRYTGLTSDDSPAAVAVTPAEMRAAYGVDAISVNGTVGTGANQTIAIIDAYEDPDLAADVSTFNSDFGLQQFGATGSPTLKIIRQNGTTVAVGNEPPADTVDPVGDSWAIETSLDVEWAHVIAPQANIVVVLADSSSSLYTAIKTGEKQTGVSVVSMSFGGTDEGGTADSDFQRANVTFVASTGDSGAYTTSGTNAGASYPASSPDVVSVGGTTLLINGSSGYGSETAWSGSGGGLSTVEAEPTYQKTVVPSTITTTQRALPDVAMDADPQSGVAVIDSYDFGNSNARQYGGTSLAAPMFAGIIAITNQERVANGEKLLNVTSPTEAASDLYTLPTTDFNDITSGSNGAYSALTGYDLVTGRGTPRSTALIPGLVAAAAVLPPYVTASTGAEYSFNATTGTLTLTSGTLTFSADSAGSAYSTYKEITLTLNGAAAHAIFSSSQHLVGLTLTGGATATMTSLGSARTHSNHDVLVIGTLTGTPTFSIDAASKLDLTDNDMIIHNGNLAATQAAAATGRNVAPGGLLDGAWTGNGLTSSAAAAADAVAGYELTTLAVVLGSDLPLGEPSSYQVGSFSEQLNADDIIVKYTYSGDFDLDGDVSDNDATIFGALYDGGKTKQNDFAFGDTNGDGKIDDTDATAFGAVYGNGTSGSGLPQL
jgi:subtilase family serine protease